MAETLAAKQARLDKVNAAIDNLLDGGVQSLNDGDKGHTALSLDSLMRTRDRLMAEIATLDTGGGRLHASFKRPGARS